MIELNSEQNLTMYNTNKISTESTVTFFVRGQKVEIPVKKIYDLSKVPQEFVVIILNAISKI